MFALVDVNNFYASCETIFRPDLKGKPVVVLSNNDGCVISRSAEAKQLGIKMGVPFFMMQEELRKHRLHIFSSNYTLYADMSARVMDTLEEMAPAVEIYSIDEAFLDLSGVSNVIALEAFGQQIRRRILREVHLSVGVGIAPTKTLAKLANYAAKKWPQFKGVVDLSNSERQRKLLARVPVEEVWGVGRRISKTLNGMGILNAKDLADQSTWVIRKHFNVVLERTVRELRGEPCLELDEIPTRQQIVCSRSFGTRISRYPEMRQAICAYAERAAEKLRREKQYCRQIAVFLSTSPHAEHRLYYRNQASGKLTIPSNDTRDIIRVAVDALDRIWRDDHQYMKAGVMLSDFFSHGVAQLDLFTESPPRPGSEGLMQLMDDVNQRGKCRLFFAGQGIAQAWSMKREMLSPGYTTRLGDVRWVK